MFINAQRGIYSHVFQLESAEPSTFMQLGSIIATLIRWTSLRELTQSRASQLLYLLRYP